MVMRTAFILFFSLVIYLGAWSQEEAVKGIYFNIEKTSKIKMFKATNGKYYGKIVWLKNGDKFDMNNPDPTKHQDPILGMLLIKDFSYDASKKQWTGGTIYDPNNGKTYDCYFWFEDGNTETLHIKGYVMGMKFIGRETEWTRTQM
jgi:uncharacterized protein (DUF2147 family)